MKQEKRNERMAESQNRQGNEVAMAVINQILNWINSNVIQRRIMAISAILPTGKGTQHLGRDGPPGRARSPGSNFRNKMPQRPSLLPEQVEVKSMKSMNINNLIQTKIQLFTNINYFKIMKKQILILVLFVLATFASVTKSYGQLAPRAITCLTQDALHPIAGTPYNYIIDVPTPLGTKAYTWFVTQEPNFIAGGILTPTRELGDGTSLHIKTTGTGYNNSGTPGSTLSITWKPFVHDPAKPVFVVIYVSNADGASCTSENMKVYEIAPQNAFTLDIANLEPTVTPGVAGAASTGAYGVNVDRCIHNIVSATYDPTSPDGVIYNYGIDYMFYEVVAANFLTSWKPTFDLKGVNVDETVAVEWSTSKSFPADATTHALAASGTVWSSTDVYTTATAGGIVGATGESIYVRVTLNHSSKYQGLSVEPVVLAVDGLTNLSAASATDYIGDIPNDNGVITPCPAAVADGYANDIAYQTLKPRPTISDGAAMLPTPALLPVKP